MEKIEILIEKDLITKIKYKSVSGKKSLNRNDKEKFIKLVTLLADEIVQSWINYFILHKQIVAKKLSGPL